MMAVLDEKLSLAAEQLLKRPLADEERLEIYRLADIFGMKDVHSFLYLLLVFKLHEDTMKGNLSEIAALEKKIQGTLESSVGRILGEGAERIGADMGKTIAERSKEMLASLDEFHVIRGYIVAASVTGIAATLAYWFGLSGALRLDGIGGPFVGLLLLPAGWWMLFSFASYTYFWCFDNWEKVKSSAPHKCLLALQGIVMFILLANMLSL